MNFLECEVRASCEPHPTLAASRARVLCVPQRETSPARFLGLPATYALLMSFASLVVSAAAVALSSMGLGVRARLP